MKACKTNLAKLVLKNKNIYRNFINGKNISKYSVDGKDIVILLKYIPIKVE